MAEGATVVARRLLVEHGDRVVGMPLGVLAVGVVPVEDRQQPVVDADADDVVRPLAQLEGSLARGDRLWQAVDEVALVGQQLEQLGLLGGRRHHAVVEGDGEEVGCFVVRT